MTIDPGRRVTILSCDLRERSIHYALDDPVRDDEPILRRFTQVVGLDALRELQRAADDLLHERESPHFSERARAVGASLYSALVPDGLADELRHVRGPLLVSTPLEGIPWEMLHDGEEFLGLRCALGRRVEREGAVPTIPSWTPRAATRPRALIIGSDPGHDLPFVSAEVERVDHVLATALAPRLVNGRGATTKKVLGYMNEPPGLDLLHYCGHIVREGAEGPALLLAESVRLPAANIRILGRPVVFLNGCASARDLGAGRTPGWEGDLASMAHQFLVRGAIAVLGTVSDVSDERAAEIAEEFYRRLLDPLPLGEALRRAREHCRRTRPESPAWLSFVLYGNPAQLPGWLREERPGNSVAVVKEPLTCAPTVAEAPVTKSPPPGGPATPGISLPLAVWVWGLLLIPLVAGVWWFAPREWVDHVTGFIVPLICRGQEEEHCLVERAKSLDARGEYAVAEACWRRVLVIQEAKLGSDDLSIAATHNNLAEALRQQGRFPEAERLYRQALVAFERGGTPTQRAMIMSNLGLLLRDSALRARPVDSVRLAEAASFQIRALKIRKRANDENVEQSMNNVGLVLRLLNRQPLAEKLYQRSRKGYRRRFGPDSLREAVTIDNLGVLFADERRYPEAEQYFRGALRIKLLRLRDPCHPDVVHTRRNLIALLPKMDQKVEADDLEKALRKECRRWP